MKKITVEDVIDGEYSNVVRLESTDDISVALYELNGGADGYAVAIRSLGDGTWPLESLYASGDRKTMNAFFEYAVAVMNLIDAGVVLKRGRLCLSGAFESYPFSLAMDVLVENGDRRLATTQTTLRDFVDKAVSPKIQPAIVKHTQIERSIDRMVAPRGCTPMKFGIRLETVTDGDVKITFSVDGKTKESVRVPEKYADDSWKLLYNRLVAPDNPNLVEEEILDGFKKLKFIFSAK